MTKSGDHWAVNRPARLYRTSNSHHSFACRGATLRRMAQGIDIGEGRTSLRAQLSRSASSYLHPSFHLRRRKRTALDYVARIFILSALGICNKLCITISALSRRSKSPFNSPLQQCSNLQLMTKSSWAYNCQLLNKQFRFCASNTILERIILNFRDFGL